MAKIATEKQVNTFVKGLITEASPLTYPENASLSEENFTLNLDGSRSRRLGLDYELAYVLNSTGISTAVLSSTRMSAHRWDFPGGSTNVILGVIRVSDRLYFINLLESNPSAHLMNSGSSPIYTTISGLGNADIQTTIISNYFIITSDNLPNPIILSYDKTLDKITYDTITIKVRDFFGVDDGLLSNFRPASLTNTHKYNLRNQGWSPNIRTVGDVLVSYQAEIDPYTGEWIQDITIPGTLFDAIDYTKEILNVYPSNADQWVLGKIGSTSDINKFEKYDPNSLFKNSFDNSQVARGGGILNIFSRGTSRQANTSITSLPLDRETGVITTCATYAGRVFYSGIVSNVTSGDNNSPNLSGFVLFTQVVDSKDKLGLCYQENDPTSPDISDILDTDGGTVQILGANKIVKLVEGPTSLIVFAENGIWEIFGDTGGFLATSYQTNKVSSIGITNPKTVVNANGTIVYWNNTGIHVLVVDPQSGRLTSQNLSLSTIQTYYNSIPILAKVNARGFYDETNNTIRWIYNDSDTYSETNYINRYTKELNLSLSLQAFYLTTISSLATNSPYICDYVPMPGTVLSTIDSDIYVGDSQVVITSLDPVIVTLNNNTTPRIGDYSFLTFTGNSFTLSKYNNQKFKDWESADTVGVDYSSFLVTGYELFGDILREKQVPYIKFYLTRTEDGFETIGGNLELKHQSSCLVQSQWNWTDSANSGKWGTQFQAYRLLRPYVPSGVGDPFDYGESVIITKNKLRGSGTCLSLKIQSSAGKDMKLLGWALEGTGDSKA